MPLATNMCVVSFADVAPAVAAEFAVPVERGREWVEGLQSRNGGWGAFDADNTHLYLNHIPFADHGALLDPPTEDVTARCVSMLAQLGSPDMRTPIAHCLAWPKRMPVTLPRLVGLRKATEILLTNPVIDAAELMSIAVSSAVNITLNTVRSVKANWPASFGADPRPASITPANGSRSHCLAGAGTTS